MLAIGPVLGSTGAVVMAQGRATGGVSAYVPAPVQAVVLQCPSPALGGTLPALVYLPAGYNGSRTRYRVIYFLHGLPAGPTTYQNDGFVAAAVSAAKKSAIVVAPQGARTVGADREYLNWSPTEDWPAAISHDLVTCIDHRYRTIANRDGRALMGLSAGGYGAFNIGLRSLQTFAAVESWSGYFEATNPAGTAVLNLGSVEAQAAATVPSDASLASQIAHYPAYVGFYVGAQDARFLQDN
jgi:S-formylglutathione hydrolase FrmB